MILSSIAVCATPFAVRLALGWLADERERTRLEAEIANGWQVDQAVTLASLRPEDRARFALSPDPAYRKVSAAQYLGVVPGGEAFEKGIPVLSPWAVWITGPLLDRSECATWVSRAEGRLETGDFIFKTGKGGFERMATGLRRLSSTVLIDDPAFAELIEARLLAQGGVPAQLNDGRRFRGIRSQFLLSQYTAREYFAPHFDGATVASEDVERGATHGRVGAFTCVLYLSDAFEGGETHYLPGQGSEVQRAVAVRPALGCASVHRALTVLHAGGELRAGVKTIMQFALLYDAPKDKAAASALVRPLRWGA